MSVIVFPIPNTEERFPNAEHLRPPYAPERLRVPGPDEPAARSRVSSDQPLREREPRTPELAPVHLEEPPSPLPQVCDVQGEVRRAGSLFSK